MTAPAKDLTALLIAWGNGDQASLGELVPLVYDELRRIARRHLRRERPDHTLQATALIHEAYLRLIDQKKVRWQGRAHFYGVAAAAMRRILVDHARRHNRAKRGGSARQVPLEETAALSTEPAAELIALDETLGRLSAIDPRKGGVVELRFFAGLSIEEAAAVLEVSPATVMHDWTLAKAWLRREIGHGS